MPSTMTAARIRPRRHEVGRPAPAPSGHRRLALALILTAAFMVVLDFSIVNVALAVDRARVRLLGHAVQWIVTGYAIAFGGLLILGGRAADTVRPPPDVHDRAGGLHRPRRWPAAWPMTRCCW